MNRAVCWTMALLISGGTCAWSADADSQVLSKLAKRREETARKTYQVLWRDYRERIASADGLYRWSKRWLDAEMQLSDQPVNRRSAYQHHFERMRDLERLIHNVQRAGQATIDEVSAAEYYRAEAEYWLQAAKDGKKGQEDFHQAR